MIILSTVLLIFLNGLISSMINIRHGRNYANYSASSSPSGSAVSRAYPATIKYEVEE